MKKRLNWKVLVICLVVVYATAFIGSIFTSAAVNTEWYDSIRPSITPPNWVFPVVWNILFFLISISLYYAWTSANKKSKQKVAIVFAINLILNASWSYFYFKMQNPLSAFYIIILIWFSILSMIYITYKINKTASYLLIPYFLWVSFASILNYLSIP